jgi:hypothetical protein
VAKTIFRCWSVFLLLAVVGLAHGAERVLKVGVIHHSPPMSYVDASGGLTGFNVEVMRELCKELAARCETVVLTLDRVVDAVAAGEVDFAAVSLLVTPERRARLLLTKPYYRSISVWFARPGVKPGEARVAVVKGGIQARYAQARGWAQLPSTTTRPSLERLPPGRPRPPCCRWRTPSRCSRTPACLPRVWPAPWSRTRNSPAMPRWGSIRVTERCSTSSTMPSTRSSAMVVSIASTRASSLSASSDDPAKPADVHRTWRAGRVLLALTSVFAAIAVCGVVWLAVDLYAVGVAAGRLQGETVPWTIERQRLGAISNSCASRASAY